MLKYNVALILLFALTNISHGMSILKALNDPASSGVVNLESIPKQEKIFNETGLAKLQDVVSNRLESIKKSRLVFSWDVASPRDRTPNYCINQCACLNRELVKLLKDQYQVRTLTLRPSTALDVSIRDKRGSFLSYTFYHMVTLVKLQESWFVIDPVVLSSGQPELLSQWLQRLEFPEKLSGQVH